MPTMLLERSAECALIDRMLASTSEQLSGALVILGEPGVGKSVLLDYAAGRAEGARVLRCMGVQAELELAFAGLHQLVRPVLDHVERLSEPHAAALRGALGLAPSGDDSRFLVSAALLSLLSDVAEERPLLCLIDDAQWLDEASADALMFAARRLEAEGVVMLIAAREAEANVFLEAGLPRLRLTDLSDEAAATLLRESAGPVPGDVARQLIAGTGGNPLALRGLATALTAEQLAGREPLPDPLPLSTGLEQAFLAMARRLPEGTQRILLLAAADDSEELDTLLRASERSGVDGAALDPAEEAGLLRIADSRASFDHPLMRSAVYRGATWRQRRAAHLALAEVLDDDAHADRRAWHRAAAVIGVDDEVADELEQSAGRARRRGGYAAAGAALARAATLSGDDAERARRLAAAAHAYWLAGRPQQALSQLRRVGAVDVRPDVRADMDHLRGTIELRCGAPTEALQTLMAGATAIAPLDPARALRMLAHASEAASYVGDARRATEAGRRAAELPPERRDGEAFTVRLVVGIGHVLDGDIAHGAPLLREAVSLAQDFDDPVRLVDAGAAARYVGDDVATEAFSTKAVALARRSGAVGILPHTLDYRAWAEVAAGRYQSATAHATEGLRWARETGQPNIACRHLGTLAWVAAVQGREDDCVAQAAEALGHANAQGLGLHAANASWALALLDLGLGRLRQALDRLEGLRVAGPGAGHPLIALFAAPDLIEAAARIDRMAAAQSALAAFERWAAHAAPPWAMALLSRCRGLLSEGVAAERHFAEALSLHAESSRPFDTARTELAFGEALRRARQPAQARPHLRAALEVFERLGATPWEQRARGELRASGETARKRRPGGAALQLTSQELQIARFVAQGATNRETAAQLFLSPRTVDYHMRSIFVKLGISSRAELIRLQLEADPAPNAAHSA